MRDAFGNETGEPAEPPRAPSPARRTALGVVVVALIVAGAVAAVVVGLGGKDHPASQSAAAEAPTTEQPASAGLAPPPRPASLLRPRVLADALARISGRGRLRLLRVAPDRVDAQLVTPSGASRNVQVTAAGRLRDFGTAGSGAAGLPTIPYTRVDVRAPARMVRAAAARSGRPAQRVDYLVLLMLQDGQSWNLYFKPDALHFAGDLHGQHVVQR